MLPRAGSVLFPTMYPASMYTTSYFPYMSGVYVVPQQNVQVVQPQPQPQPQQQQQQQQQPVVDLPPTFQWLNSMCENVQVFELANQLDPSVSGEQQAGLQRLNFLFSYVVLWLMASPHVREVVHSVFQAMQHPGEPAKPALPGEASRGSPSGESGERPTMASLSPSVQPMVSVLKMSPAAWGSLSEVEVLEGLAGGIAALMESSVLQRASKMCVDIIASFLGQGLLTKYQQFGISLRERVNGV